MLEAQENIRIALQNELTPAQSSQLSNTVTAWIVKNEPDRRAALLEALLSEMKIAAPQATEFKKQVLNSVHLVWAFDAYRSRQWGETSRHAMQALRSNTTLIRNKGLLSIWARSTLASLGYTKLVGQTQSVSDAQDCEYADAIRTNVERMMGGPVQNWKSLTEDSPLDNHHRVYSFSHNGTRLIARVAKTGAVRPPRAVLEKVVDAGIPAPTIVFEQDATPNVPAIRIKTFIEGDALILARYPQDEVSRLVEELSEVIRRLHSIPVGSFGILDQGLDATGATFSSLRESLEQNVLVELLNEALPAQAIDAAEHAFELLDACPYAGPPLLCHGDLHPENIHIKNSHLSGVIDWESAQGNDPAYEIAVLLATTIDYWYPMHADAFMHRVVDAGIGSLELDVLCRVKAYMALRLMFELTAAVKFSSTHIWRNAGKMRDFLIAAADPQRKMLHG